ncbi:MAG: Gfo/Idh/MocA family oxidoreductase, partial [Acidobacteriia bacterium]|nr:Gfo/Idh/MocA family oxidoreductase [Terriglobia bacterium]
MSDNRFSRRYFFYGSLLAGAVPAGGFGSQASLKAAGYKSINEKLNIAAIGLGTRGPEILRYAAATENVVALCDVSETRLAAASKPYDKAKTYKDFRKLLEAERNNIDAVMIATPDHLHTPVAMAAMQLGKHVYCEKPLTRTPTEARLLADAAVKYKVATQMGNQGWNHEATKTACEILWSGDIGEVRELHAWTGGIYGGYPNLPPTGPEKQPIPSGLEWELWLGPAAPHDFNQAMMVQWRAYLDFATGGSMGDWLVHNVGPAHLALQLDKAPPISVECVKVEGKSEWLWPLRDHVMFEFPARGTMPPVTVHLYQNMRGDFKNPEGMGENDRLFPGMNNLAEKGRPVTQSGDGILALSPQIGVEVPGARGGQAGRGPGGMQGR